MWHALYLYETLPNCSACLLEWYHQFELACLCKLLCWPWRLVIAACKSFNFGSQVTSLLLYCYVFVIQICSSMSRIECCCIPSECSRLYCILQMTLALSSGRLWHQRCSPASTLVGTPWLDSNAPSLARNAVKTFQLCRTYSHNKRSLKQPKYKDYHKARPCPVVYL